MRKTRRLSRDLLASLFLLWLTAFGSLAIASGKSNLLVLGDSLSAAYGVPYEQGWVSLLEQRLAEEHPDYHVINASISGETSGGGLARLPELLSRHQPDIVIIELGGNDGLRGFPVKILRNNLSKMVAMSLDTGAKVLLAGMHIPPNYGPAYTEAFFASYHTVANDYSIDLLPFLLEGIGTNAGLMQSDGIHPTAEAQPMILDNVWPRLEPLL